MCEVTRKEVMKKVETIVSYISQAKWSKSSCEYHRLPVIFELINLSLSSLVNLSSNLIETIANDAVMNIDVGNDIEHYAFKENDYEVLARSSKQKIEEFLSKVNGKEKLIEDIQTYIYLQGCASFDDTLSESDEELVSLILLQMGLLTKFSIDKLTEDEARNVDVELSRGCETKDEIYEKHKEVLLELSEIRELGFGIDFKSIL
jgi:hypothetical protein